MRTPPRASRLRPARRCGAPRPLYERGGVSALTECMGEIRVRGAAAAARARAGGDTRPVTKYANRSDRAHSETDLRRIAAPTGRRDTGATF